MATHKVPLKKMASADVKFVSMVGRAANRIPFRVIKRDKESGMLNLSGLGRVLKGQPETKAEAKPEIVAVVVEKGEFLSEVTAAVQEAGFAVDNVVENDDNTVSFIQKQAEEGEDLTLVRMDENTVVVVKGFSAYCEHLKDFNEIVAANGFYQSLGVATEAFRDAVYKGLYASDNAAEAVTKAEKVVGDFANYVKGLINGLPANAFYVSKGVSEAVLKGAGMKNKDKSKEDEEEAMKGKDKAKKDEAPDLTVVPDDMAKNDWNALSDEQKLEHIQKGAPKDQAAVETPAPTAPTLNVEEIVQKTAEAVLKAVSPKLDALGSKVEQLETANSQINEKVDSVVQKSETVAKQLGTTVIAATTAHDTPSNDVATVQKEEDPRTGAFDTAMIRKSAERRSIRG